DERDGPVAGHELAKPRDRPAGDRDPGAGEDGVVRVARDRIRDHFVERAPLLVQPAELRFVLRERPVASAHALPRRVDVDVEPDGDRAIPERLADDLRRHGAAAEREDVRLGLPAQERGRELLLLAPELVLAALAEE